MGIDGVAGTTLGNVQCREASLYTCEEFKTGRLSFLGESNLGLPAVASAFTGAVPEPYSTYLL